MHKADFNHLVRLSEYACAENMPSYRRGLAFFAALGYAWVIACFLLAITIMTWATNAMLQNNLKLVYLGWVVAGVLLLWTSLKALWCPVAPPTGIVLKLEDAPILFEGLERIRKSIKGPPIHHILLDDAFNASITQLPRYGLFGGSVNYLTIGLPLLMAIDKSRFFAVMAHEYGHLRSGHGQFSAWIYRTRLSWSQLAQSMRGDASLVAVATHTFLSWYFPRFLARSFALARQDEYEADRFAAKLLGREVMGAALAEISLKGNWLVNRFWQQHWQIASQQTQALGPFSSMRTALSQALPDDYAQDALKLILRKISTGQDTHPVLRDRLEALKAAQTVPLWSSRSALSMLGTKAESWIAHFDKQWCTEYAGIWQQHHAYLNRINARVSSLTASLGRNNADEMAELGDLHKRLNPLANVRSHYERALQITPNHAGGLSGLVACLHATERPLRLDCLNKLYEASTAKRWWACLEAVDALKVPNAQGDIDESALRTWRERLKPAEEAESRAWDELVHTPFFQAISRHDLNEFELGECHSSLARYTSVKRAWLVRKNLREFPYRRCYVLFVDLPTLSDDNRYDVCRSLEQSIDLPGQVLAIYAGESPTLAEIQSNAFEAVYTRG